MAFVIIMIVTSSLDLEVGVGVIDGTACGFGQRDQGREIG